MRKRFMVMPRNGERVDAMPRKMCREYGATRRGSRYRIGE